MRTSPSGAAAGAEDRAALGRRYAVEYSPERRERFRSFHRGWQGELQRLPFESLTRPAQVDYLLLDNKLRYELSLLDRDEQLAAEMGIAEDGYRLMVNCNRHGGQHVYHLHMHLLGGQRMRYPMG